MTISAVNLSSGILDVEDLGIFDADISDAALEIAAAPPRDRTASMTLAFCSGLDECPHHGPRARSRDLISRLLFFW